MCIRDRAREDRARIVAAAHASLADEVIERLASVPAGQGYGKFILGLLSHVHGNRRDARAYLQAFVERTEAGRPVTTIALDAELTRARRVLALMSRGR